MARSGVKVHSLVAIILLALVFVHDPDTNWGTQCNTELCARLNLHAIFLVSWGCDRGLTGAAASHLGLDVALREGHTRRAAIDDGTYTEAVGLSIAVAISRYHQMDATSVRTW